AALTAKSHALPVPELDHVPSEDSLVGVCDRRNQQETCRTVVRFTTSNKLNIYETETTVGPTQIGRKLTSFVSRSRAVWRPRGRRAARASGACSGIDGTRGRATPPREPAASPSVRAQGGYSRSRCA